MPGTAVVEPNRRIAMIMSFIALDLAVYATAILVWHLGHRPGSAIGPYFGRAKPGLTGERPVDLPAVPSDWTPLDELQLIRLLTDSAS